MTKIITFNELRRVKDSLPDGSMQIIADRLNVNVETVRNYFGGTNYKDGSSVGFHLEPGPDGGVVTLDDATILDIAYEIISKSKKEIA
ncbi:MAG TPA: DNA-binding protein [Bacteroidales bacterium]|nr:DNA-binding protein [Bacteroidales bacterium]